VQKNLPRKAELAWQVSRWLNEGSFPDSSFPQIHS
jgi:hypothetical protein